MRTLSIALPLLLLGVSLHAAPTGDRLFLTCQLPKHGEWHLGLINGELAFLAQLADVEDRPDMPRIPYDKGGMREAFRWVRDGDTLQIDVRSEQRDEAKVQAEKHRWFLTAKYTGKGSEVVLTKEATKYSHWQFLDINADLGGEAPRYHVKNVNDLGKDAWLGIAAEGVRYQGQKEIRNPILSLDKPQWIIVEYPSGK
jgi:hypothetical protein